MWQIRCAVEVGESHVVLGNSGLSEVKSALI
jgi:hypothetical protein